MTAPNRDQPTTSFNDPVSELGMSTILPRDQKFSFLEPSTEPGDLGRLAQYRVLKLLGAGGMGYVFEAEDTHLARRVALKVMRPEFASDPGFRERFLIEARAAAGLTSDYIVTVYQVGTAGDVPFQAIQLLAGESLQERLQKGSPLPVGMVCVILRQVAEGLAVAHEKGLIHRDIKPANIWLESSRPGGPFRRARILDFGLARSQQQDTKLTATGMIVGTPHYMAPEQASGQAVDGRADLFSLGCVAYTMLTGKMAFDGSSTIAVLMALANHVPPPVNQINPLVPAELSDLVASLIAKELGQRLSSAAELCVRIDAILAANPALLQDMEVPSGQVPRSDASSHPAPSTSVRVAGPTPAPHHSTSRPLRAQTSTVPPPKNGRRLWWVVGAGGSILLTIAIGLVALSVKRNPGSGGPSSNPDVQAPIAAGAPITVGILHSLSGTMALNEAPVVDATRLALDEVNAAGGVLGRKLVPVVLDGASDPDQFAKAAERLLNEHKAAVVFGCWTSASRKAVRTVVERNGGLLFYPVQFEGLENSPRIVYLGPAPNQQLAPGIEYVIERLGTKRFFLIGSDYVYPHAAHEISKDLIRAKEGKGVSVVGEAYLPLGTKDMARTIADIKASKADVILNTINGTTNFHFFRELNADEVTRDIPVLSMSVSEPDIRSLELKGIVGDYLAGSYFESVGSASGKAFMKQFRERYGQERRYSDQLAAAYSGVQLWAKAAMKAGSLEPDAVLKAIRGMTFSGPSGEITVDPDNEYCWLPSRIGQIQPDGSVRSVWESDKPVRPVPFPSTRSRSEWDHFLNNLFLKWDGQWQPPRP